MKIDYDRLSVELDLKIQHFSEIDSTSLYAKRLITQNQTPPQLILADHQTNGQGRVGKTFYSPNQTGLYMTFVFPMERITCDDVTPRTALAVSNAVDKVFSIKSGVKWVNDIYYLNRKISGILVQRVSEYALIGVGINVEKPKRIPSDLKNRFGYLTDHVKSNEYENLVREIYFQLNKSYRMTKNEVLTQYRERCIHIGQEVILEYNGEESNGVCVGITDEFHLSVDHAGTVKEYSSGYMTLKINV